MTFVPKRKQYRLDFAGHDTLNGLEVTLHGMSIGEFLEVQKLQGLTEDDNEGTTQMIQHFVDHLVAWNVTTETGVAVLPTMEAVAGLDVDTVLEIISAWLRAIAGVSAPLDGDSTSGLSSLEESIGTETLSPALAS